MRYNIEHIKAMKRIKKHNLVVGLLFAYTTGMYIYFFPRNSELSTTEKWAIIAASYIILIILWFVMRGRDRLRKKREQEMFGSPDKKAQEPPFNIRE